MAKITTEYDTQTKKLSVARDGQQLDNVHHASFSRTYDSNEASDENAKHEMRVSRRTKNDDGTCDIHHIVANEKGELVIEKVEPANSKLSGLIGQYLESRRPTAKKKS